VKLSNLGLSAALLSLGVLSSQALALEKAVMQTRLAASEPVQFNLYLPILHRDQLETDLTAMHTPGSPTYHKWLTPAQFDERYAATPAQINAIVAQLNGLGLEATPVAGHRIHVSGTATAIEKAFSTTLFHAAYQNGNATIMSAHTIATTGAMQQAGAIVTGLSGTIRMHSFARKTAAPAPDNRYSAEGPYWFDDLKQAYSYPSYALYNGTGTTIGILMSKNFQQSDMDLYFNHEKLTSPSFTTINVDGGAPFDPNDSLETQLDMQQSGGMAPKAKVLLYNVPDLSDDSIMDGLSQILTDNKTDVVNMSFGEAELFYTAADNDGEDFTYLLKEEDDLFAQGNAQGITFVASSGDSGALAAVPVACFNFKPGCGTFQLSVNFPASSPHVVGVGGTNLKTTYFPSSPYTGYISEEANADPLSEDIFYGTSATGGYWGSGGGTSILFARPAFQVGTNTGSTTFRTVPDLALHMGGCPGGVVGTCNRLDSADLEALNGILYGVIGTSASSPDFTGLIALGVQEYGTRLGNANYYVYELAQAQAAGTISGVFHQGQPGFNGYYHTTSTGYNRVLGNGTVIGTGFLLNPTAPVAGIPQSPSNP
jgi:kumamolisin